MGGGGGGGGWGGGGGEGVISKDVDKRILKKGDVLDCHTSIAFRTQSRLIAHRSLPLSL